MKRLTSIAGDEGAMKVVTGVEDLEPAYQRCNLFSWPRAHTL